MHGLVNHAVQCFVRDAYGAEAWRKVSRAAGVGPEGFEPMLDYDDHVTHELLLAAAKHLDKAPEALLEDLGTYLVSHESQRRVRRLLRFSGETFSDFLHALDDLPSRAKLAMPDLDLPELELREDPPGCFRLFVLARQPAWGYVMLGLLRAMADDFGALVVIDIAPSTSSVTVIEISLHDGAFAAGRSFSLSGVEPDPELALAPLADDADDMAGVDGPAKVGRQSTTPGPRARPAGAGRKGGSEAPVPGTAGPEAPDPGATVSDAPGPETPDPETPDPAATMSDTSHPAAPAPGAPDPGTPDPAASISDTSDLAAPDPAAPAPAAPGPAAPDPEAPGPVAPVAVEEALPLSGAAAPHGAPGTGPAESWRADDPVERVLTGAQRAPAGEDRK